MLIGVPQHLHVPGHFTAREKRADAKAAHAVLVINDRYIAADAGVDCGRLQILVKPDQLIIVGRSNQHHDPLRGPGRLETQKAALGVGGGQVAIRFPIVAEQMTVQIVIQTIRQSPLPHRQQAVAQGEARFGG